MMDAVIFERKQDALEYAEMILKKQGVLSVCKPKRIVQSIEMNTIHNTFDGTVDWPRQWIVVPLSSNSIDDLMPKVKEQIKKLQNMLADAEDAAAEAQEALEGLMTEGKTGYHIDDPYVNEPSHTVDSVWSGDEVID